MGADVVGALGGPLLAGDLAGTGAQVAAQLQAGIGSGAGDGRREHRGDAIGQELAGQGGGGGGDADPGQVGLGGHVVEGFALVGAGAHVDQPARGDDAAPVQAVDVHILVVGDRAGVFGNGHAEDTVVALVAVPGEAELQGVAGVQRVGQLADQIQALALQVVGRARVGQAAQLGRGGGLGQGVVGGLIRIQEVGRSIGGRGGGLVGVDAEGVPELVLDDRSAEPEGGGGLVTRGRAAGVEGQAGLGTGLGDHALGTEGELRVRMEVIGTGLGHDGDDAARGTAVFRLVAAGLDLDGLDRQGVHAGVVGSENGIGDVHAVHDVVVLEGRAATDVGIGGATTAVHDARGKVGSRGPVTAGQGHSLQVLGREGPRLHDGGVVDGDRAGGGEHLNRGGRGAGRALDGEVLGVDLPGIKRQAGGLSAAALANHLDGVAGAGGGQGEAEDAVRTRHHGSGTLQAGAGQDDLGAGENLARSVGHLAGEHAGGGTLGVSDDAAPGDEGYGGEAKPGEDSIHRDSFEVRHRRMGGVIRSRPPAG